MLTKGIYKHYKGNLYEVIDTAKHSETEEEFVVYKPLYNDTGLWIRPLSMFLETVILEGTKVPRFAFTGKSS